MTIHTTIGPMEAIREENLSVRRRVYDALVRPMTSAYLSILLGEDSLTVYDALRGLRKQGRVRRIDQHTRERGYTGLYERVPGSTAPYTGKRGRTRAEAVEAPAERAPLRGEDAALELAARWKGVRE